MVSQVSVTATFFWLSGLGYFIWKTFRSRNVFLRITDGKKYCWYSFYVWSCTICMAALGIFSHYYLDFNTPKKSLPEKFVEIESIGELFYDYTYIGLHFISINFSFSIQVYWDYQYFL